LRLCGYRQCDNEFEPRTHNQKYCNDECCRLETNAVVMDRYYERKHNRAGAKRTCSEAGCQTVLSRYNSGVRCGQHSGSTRQNVFAIMEGIL
jgi:hypothetical protein